MGDKIRDNVGVMNMHFNSGKEQKVVVSMAHIHVWQITLLALTLADQTGQSGIKKECLTNILTIAIKWVPIFAKAIYLPCGSNLIFELPRPQTSVKLLNV